jgi:L-seryl-tRNA(Ser) seleniumtransferase
VTDPRDRTLQRIPQVDVLARQDEIGDLLGRVGRALGLRLLREILEGWRRRIRSGEMSSDDLDRAVAELPRTLERHAAAATEPSLVRVINATGVVVHTNLGRAVLCEAARSALERAAAGYSNLEYDLGRGRRGSRGAHLARPLQALFPERAALAVNNNAGALLLALNTLARGREVVVSRGELVEIGGSFRIPEIMERSGAILREVGTTNRTRLEDYRRAITGRTAVLLKVHPSNYRILGFTEEAQLADLVALGAERGVPVVLDQGSGNLVDLSAHGVEEPTVGDLLAGGAQMVLFSGDKLLGGPQAGIAVGDPDLVSSMGRNPLARALRLDKGTAAALEATLLEYVRGRAMKTVPVLRMIATTEAEIADRATSFVRALRRQVVGSAAVEARSGGSVVGGGAWPLGTLPTRLVAVRPGRGEAGELERALRAGAPPVVARVEEGQLLLDLRTVLPEEEGDLLQAVAAALSASAP